MGQLTNLYVSQSYQGLIKLADSTTGVTGTLQYTQDGVGNNLPLQISTTTVNVTGSLLVNGQPIEFSNTGSFATTGSNVFNGNQIITGSVNITGNYLINGSPVIGSQGPQGPTGPTGAQGNQGNTGVQGAQGNTGIQGSQGNQGNTGVQGAQGNQGNTGVQGAQGNQGNVGPQGNQGNTGLTGPTGPQGNQGNTGAQGNQGTQGTQGTQGNQGNVGPVGPQGNQGDTGAQGNQGNTGAQGDIGPQGNQGNTGPIGPQGNQGNTGAQGNQGNQGNQGTNGQSNSLFPYNARTNITSGNPGNTNIIWNNATQSGATEINVSHLDRDNNDIDVFLALIPSGTTIIIQDANDSDNFQKWVVGTGVEAAPNSYWTFPITFVSGGHQFTGGENILFIVAALPQGPQGTQGVQGAQGVQGNTGAQGNQGNTGPQGDIGLTGPQGNQGNTGPIGPQGNQGNTGPIGPQGNQGNTGAQGDIGVTGPQGNQGNTGGTGPQGNQGNTGAQGPIGPTPSFDSGSYATTGSNQFSGSQEITGALTLILYDQPYDSYFKIAEFGATSGDYFQFNSNVEVDSGNLTVAGDIKTNGITDKDGSNILTISGSQGVNIIGQTSITGSLEGTSSYATNALTASYALNSPGGGSIETGSFATTGSNVFVGNQTISGSLTQSGSLIHTGSINQAGNIFLRPQFLSGITFNHVTQSNEVSASNIIGMMLNSPTLTGSIILSGSNNIILNAQRSATPVGSLGLMNGSGNILTSTVFPTLSSGSLGSFTFDRNIGIGVPTVFAPYSGSLNSALSNNIGANGFNVNNYSGSINIAGNGLQGTLTINNGVSSSTTGAHSLSLTQNAIFGTHTVTMIGTSVGTARLLSTNLIAGNTATIFSNVATNTGSLLSTLIVGNNLIVSASSGNSAGIAGALYGGAFVGRYNDDSGTLANTHETVFAVGTGTGTGAKRTSLLVSGSGLTVVRNGLNVTGSLNVIGDTTITGSLILSGSANPELIVIGNTILTGSVQGNVNALSISSNTASLDLNTGNFFTLQLVSGSNTFINPSNIKAGQTVNILLSTTGSATVSFPTNVDQASGSSYVPTTTTGKDIITLVSFDSSTLYLANVKNLI